MDTDKLDEVESQPEPALRDEEAQNFVDLQAFLNDHIVEEV